MMPNTTKLLLVGDHVLMKNIENRLNGWKLHSLENGPYEVVEESIKMRH